MGPLGHDPLRPVPDLIGLVAGPVPPDDPGIGRILEDIFQGSFFKGLSLASFKAEAIQIPGQGKDAHLVVYIPVKDHPDNFRFLRNDFRGRIVVRDPVSQGRAALVPSVLGFGLHAAGDILGQIVRVKLILPFDDHFNQTAVHTIQDRFRDADHIDAQLFPQHSLVEGAFILVPGKSGKFPDQDTVKGLWGGLGSGDHPLEFRPVVGLLPAPSLGFHEDIFFRDHDPAALGILDNGLQLGLRAQVHLAVSADPDIGGADLKGSSACHYIISSYRLYGCWV